MSNILIVEDEPSIRNLVQQVLHDDGHMTVAVDNGQAALAVIAGNCPDCVVLDLNLPLLDGEDVLRALATHHKRPPVLLMTSDPRGQRLGPADGVLGHIPKPFDLDHLSTAVALATRVSGPPSVGAGDTSPPAGSSPPDGRSHS